MINPQLLHNTIREAKSEEGFSLTELMIVIVIIGVLAMIAVPKFMNVTTEAKMTEAKMMLRQIHTLQQAYFYEHDTYASETSALGFEQNRLQTEGGTARYAVGIMQADASGYRATATAVVDFDKDGVFNTWMVNHEGVISQSTPD